MLLKNKTVCHNGTLFLDVNNSHNLHKRTNSDACNVSGLHLYAHKDHSLSVNTIGSSSRYIDIFHMETQSEYILTSQHAQHAQQKFFLFCLYPLVKLIKYKLKDMK